MRTIDRQTRVEADLYFAAEAKYEADLLRVYGDDRGARRKHMHDDAALNTSRAAFYAAKAAWFAKLAAVQALQPAAEAAIADFLKRSIEP